MAIYYGRDPDEIRERVLNPYARTDPAVKVARAVNRLRWGKGEGAEGAYIQVLEHEVRLLRAEVQRLADEKSN